MPAIVLPFILSAISFWIYLPVIPHPFSAPGSFRMPFSLSNDSDYDSCFFTLVLIKGISCGELLCHTTLILMIRCFRSHWTLPPCSCHLLQILYNESIFSFLFHTSKEDFSSHSLIMVRWYSNNSLFLNLTSVKTYTIFPDAGSIIGKSNFIFISWKEFYRFLLFCSLVCL